ncbi:MAG TPA: tripartite tricarboxylate transporter substrate binding protein [Ramlibacter sp.]|nr:tripartite tricarboxylate transporter substrate binding protein [Ramlibacter sp.]
MRKTISSWGAAAALAVLAAGAAAQTTPAWPEAKPITVVVPFPAGGAVDFAARLVATKLGERLKQTLVIDNVAGAAGVVGTAKAARAAPDGYTLLVAPDSPIVIAPLVMPATVKYDALKDLAPVGLVNVTPMMMVARPGLPVGNFADLLKLAKARPGELTYASPGVGNVLHVAMESVKHQAQIDMLHVPYKAATQIVTDLIGNQVDLAMLVPSTAMASVKAGKLKAIGVTVGQRLAVAPEIPALAESRELKDFHFVTSIGVFAPGKTPVAIVERLNRELNEVLRSPEVRAKFEEQGAVPGSGSPADFMALLRKEQARNERVVKAAAIKAE